MGDRANIAIEYENGQRIYFYGHWSGADYAQALRRALAKRWRWEDSAYLARIIWDEFCAAENHGQQTGFGIHPEICDNEHPILVVDVKHQRVIREQHHDLAAASWSFDEYVDLPPADLAWAR